MRLSKFLKERSYPHPDEVRMTLGEHLEELRSRLVRVLVALGVGTIFCFVFRSQILGFLSWQIFGVLRMQGQEPALNYFSITEPFILDVKLAMLLGAILTAPYSLVQIWGFVAAGLYAHERKWVNRFVPASVILFFTGAIFFIVIVFPAMLSFLISYRESIPDYGRHAPRWMMPGGGPTTMPAPSQGEWPSTTPMLAAFPEDPPSPPAGVPWLNTTEHEIRIRYGEKTYTWAHLKESLPGNRLDANLRLADFVLLELQMAAAFGLGFQVPVVIAFLAVIGIFTAAEMAAVRRYVYFGMAVVAAIVTPSPDVVSMILLLAPMMLLFEGGLIVARFAQKEREASP